LNEPRKYLVSLFIFVLALSLFTEYLIYFDFSYATLTPIKEAAVIYGYDWNSEATNYVAANYNLLVVDFNNSRSDGNIPFAKHMLELKTKSTSIQIFGYKDIRYIDKYHDDWLEANSNEDWFVHDDNGTRIMNTVYSTYLMDVGNAGWRQHWVSYVNDRLESCPSYNGVFADDVSDSLYLQDLSSQPYNGTIYRWHNDTLGMLEYVKANIPAGKLVIINTDAGWAPGHINFDYLDVIDGMMIEGFFHASWEEAGSFSRVFESQIKCLAQGSNDGKIMVVESGCATNDVEILKWTYANFLLGFTGTDAYWTWNIGPSYQYEPVKPSITNTYLGSPIDSCYQSQNVYMRNFTHGKVLSNLSDKPAEIELGKSFWLLNNTEVRNFTLNPFSAEILLNRPASLF
jgi:hypothetical protein